MSTTNLTEKAMLIDLSIGYWEGRKKDISVSQDVITSKKAEQDAGSWWTRIVSPSMLKNVGATVNRGRTLHHKLTLPWSDTGPRILPAAMFLQYTTKMREIEAEYHEAVKGFLKEYPQAVASAEKRLGDLFVSDHYPTAKKLADKFSWSVEVTPLPSANDFRVDLGTAETKQIKAEIESRVKQTMTSAMQDVWRRLYDAVNHIAERLGKTDNIFRDSLIDNVKELCDMLPKLNITDDTKLEQMRREVIRKLTKRSPSELRNDPQERKDAATAANTILETMQGYIGKVDK